MSVWLIDRLTKSAGGRWLDMVGQYDSRFSTLNTESLGGCSDV